MYQYRSALIDLFHSCYESKYSHDALVTWQSPVSIHPHPSSSLPLSLFLTAPHSLRWIFANCGTLLDAFFGNVACKWHLLSVGLLIVYRVIGLSKSTQKRPPTIRDTLQANGIIFHANIVTSPALLHAFMYHSILPNKDCWCYSSNSNGKNSMGIWYIDTVSIYSIAQVDTLYYIIGRSISFVNIDIQTEKKNNALIRRHSLCFLSHFHAHVALLNNRICRWQTIQMQIKRIIACISIGVVVIQAVYVLERKKIKLLCISLSKLFCNLE